jgi:hypothetical protein
LGKALRLAGDKKRGVSLEKELLDIRREMRVQSWRLRRSDSTFYHSVIKLNIHLRVTRAASGE